MKNLNTLFLAGIISLASLVAQAETNTKQNSSSTVNNEKLTSDFDSLGGNEILLDKAKSVNPEVRTQVVQNRIVDRTSRFELSGSYDNSFGGDTYVRTGTFGISGQYHINNNWSLGAKYGYSFNKLTAEGNDLADKAAADHLANPSTAKSPVPDIDYPKSNMMGFVNFYPLYGKMSWLGKGISHFDVYGQVGYGQIALDSGSTNAMSGGLGMAVWVNNHFSTRFEAIYTDYTAKYYNGPMKQGITSASVQLGWLM